MSRRISNVERSRRMSSLEGSRRMSRKMSRMSKDLECRRVSKDVSKDVECRMSKELECRRVSKDVEGSRMSKGLEGCFEGSRRMSRKMSNVEGSRRMSKDLECRRMSNVEGSRMSKGLEGCLEGSPMSKGLECRWVSLDAVFQAYYSPLLVLVCRSVSQDPPRPIEDITVASAFLYSPSTALSQSAVACVHVHLADQSAIASRQTPLFSERQAIYRSPCVNIY